jgi:hypothetical protein
MSHPLCTTARLAVANRLGSYRSTRLVGHRVFLLDDLGTLGGNVVAPGTVPGCGVSGSWVPMSTDEPSKPSN